MARIHPLDNGAHGRRGVCRAGAARAADAGRPAAGAVRDRRGVGDGGRVSRGRKRQSGAAHERVGLFGRVGQRAGAGVPEVYGDLVCTVRPGHGDRREQRETACKCTADRV